VFEVPLGFVDREVILVRRVREVIHACRKEYGEDARERKAPINTDVPNVKNADEKAEHRDKHKTRREWLFDDVMNHHFSRTLS
jgi:hypothetical protein